jgi:hypothetical protein
MPIIYPYRLCQLVVIKHAYLNRLLFENIVSTAYTIEPRLSIVLDDSSELWPEKRVEWSGYGVF